MVRFLVEEVGSDVNGMDAEGRPNFFGTPVNYAAHASGGNDVVGYLLEVSFLHSSGSKGPVHCLLRVGKG